MVTKKTSGTATGRVNTWDEQLAQQAAIAAKMEENTGGGKFFGLQGCRLTFNGNPLPGNHMVAVILDHVLENVFYEGDFDAKNLQAPCCFAFAREEKALAPHEKATKPQHPQCHGCPKNEWASSRTGRGKACRNTRRLALLSAGSIDKNGAYELETDPKHFEETEAAFLKLPVTSVKAFSAEVKRVAEALKRPPHGVFWKISVVPSDNQIEVQFEALGKVPDKVMGAIMQRHEEMTKLIDFPYQPVEDDPKGAAKKPAAGQDKKKRKF